MKSQVCMVDTITGIVEGLRLPTNVEHYSASADGKTIVFSVKALTAVDCPRQLRSDARNEDTDSSLEGVLRNRPPIYLKTKYTSVREQKRVVSI